MRELASPDDDDYINESFTLMLDELQEKPYQKLSTILKLFESDDESDDEMDHDVSKYNFFYNFIITF